MITHVTVAALGVCPSPPAMATLVDQPYLVSRTLVHWVDVVSENKVLCHPASIDTISTSAGTEDHVSMGGWAARKCLQVIDNVQRSAALLLAFI